MPKVSAVMALYNTPYNYLKATVESLLNQTFSDFELIIIDDASNMDYEEFFANLNDERIKYSKLEKNAGPGHARNVGIRQAAGEYVAICDSDDIYLPKRFELQAKFFDENPDISLTSCTFRFSNRSKISHFPLNDKDIKAFMLFNSPLSNPAIMFRKNVFIENNLFYPEDTNFAEDYELWINAMFCRIKIANLKECLMIYTRRAGQLSKAKQETQIEMLKKLYKQILSHIGLDASQEQLDLHYNIYTGNFEQISSPDVISDWFDKIIEHNNGLLDEETLEENKKQTLDKYNKIKNRLFKIKIGANNLCLGKNLRLYIEQRD